MGKLYVTEFIDNDQGSPMEPAVANQTVTYSTTTQSAAFNTATRLIRVHTDAICSVLIGDNPTATTDSRRMTAGMTEYFAVQSGHRIAAVANT